MLNLSMDLMVNESENVLENGQMLLMLKVKEPGTGDSNGGSELDAMNKIIDREISKLSYNEQLSPSDSPDLGKSNQDGINPTPVKRSSILEFNSSYNPLEMNWHHGSIDYKLFCEMLYRQQQLTQQQKLQKAASQRQPLPPPPGLSQHHSRPSTQSSFQQSSRPHSQHEQLLQCPYPNYHESRPQSQSSQSRPPSQYQLSELFYTQPIPYYSRPQSQIQYQQHPGLHQQPPPPPPPPPPQFFPNQPPYYFPQIFPYQTKASKPNTENNQQSKNNLILSPSIISIPSGSRFFVIKSFNEQDIISSFTHKVWSSTDLGNNRLSKAFNSMRNSNLKRIFLFFSVNGSGQFCGIAEMKSKIVKKNDGNNEVDDDIWLDSSRWKGKFKIQWLLIKDIPNIYLRHLKIPINIQQQYNSDNHNEFEMRPVTNSRDTQELPFEIGEQMIQIFKDVDSKTSFLQKMV